jgi:hypothetical protein
MSFIESVTALVLAMMALGTGGLYATRKGRKGSEP